MKPLAVVGVGLVSPAGFDAREHAFFVRAGTRAMGYSPFSTSDGERLRAGVCPWLGGDLPPPDRLRSLATGALGSALAPIRAALGLGLSAAVPELGLWLTMDQDRPGLGEEEKSALSRDLKAWLKPTAFGFTAGAAGFFGALGQASAALHAGKARAAAVVAVDSLIGIDALTDWIATRTSPWVREHRDPSEAGAALLLTTPEEARRVGADVLAVVHHAGVARADSHDDNDVPVDGSAMARLFAEIGGLGGPFAQTFGQHGLDALRTREFDLAIVRAHARFHAECLFQCVETKIGRVGAAAGAVHTAYGIAQNHHRTHPARVDGAAPSLAWAISRDGTRGLCALSRGNDA